MPGIFSTDELTDLQTTLGPGSSDATATVYRAPSTQISGGLGVDNRGYATKTGTFGSNPTTAQVSAGTYYCRIHDGVAGREQVFGKQLVANCSVVLEMNANQSPVILKSDRITVGSRTFEVKDPGCANTHDVVRLIGCDEIL